jgi:hypothetical protein
METPVIKSDFNHLLTYNPEKKKASNSLFGRSRGWMDLTLASHMGPTMTMKKRELGLGEWLKW